MPPRLTLDTSALLGETYEASRFISRSRAMMSLEELSEELSRFGSHLKAQLVDLLNQEYDTFIDLSRDMERIKGTISSVDQPLKEALNNVTQLIADFDQVRSALKSIHVQKQILAEKQKHLRSIIELHETIECLKAVHCAPEPPAGSSTPLSRFEANLQQYNASAILNQTLGIEPDSTSQPTFDLFMRGHTLVYMSRLLLQCDTLLDVLGQESGAARALQDEEVALKRDWHLQLEDHAIASLALPCSQPLELALEAFATQGLLQEGIRVLCTEIKTNIRPQLSFLDSDASEAELHSGFDLILETVQRNYCSVLEAKGPNDVCLPIQVLWSSMCSALLEMDSRLFSAGIPELYHRRYTAYQRFQERFREQCCKDYDRSRLTEHPSSFQLQQRWNCRVYVKLVCHKWTEELEAALRSNQLHQHPSQVEACAVYSSACASLLSTLHQSMSPSCVLPDMFLDFFTVFLQLAVRYASWFEGQVRQWSSLSLEEHVKMIWDTEQLVSVSMSALRASIMEQLPDVLSQKQDLINEALNITEEQFCACQTSIRVMLVDTLASRCASTVQTKVPRMKVKFKVSSTPAPTGYMDYVQEALAPLIKFHHVAEQCAIDSRVQSAILQDSMSRFLQDYASVVNELLESSRKTEATLQRLQQSKGAEPASISYTSKINNQLRLDITHLLTLLRSRLSIQDPQLPSPLDSFVSP